MKKWLAPFWQSFVDSFDPEEIVDFSTPFAVLSAPGAFALVFLVVGYVPAVRQLSQFEAPGVSLGLVALGTIPTLAAWRWRARGVGALGTLLDTGCYSAAVCWAAVHARGGFAIGFAVVETLAAVMIVAQKFALNLLLMVFLWLPALWFVLTGKPDPAVTIILACACSMSILTAYSTKKRRELHQNARRLEAELKESLAQLRVARERDRIARDLHDGVGAQLAGLVWRVRGLASGAATPPLRAELEAVERRVLDTIDEMRDVVLALRRDPVSWAEVTGLLDKRCKEMCGDIQVEFDVEGTPDAATLGAVFHDLVRIVFELVRNAARHAAPSKVAIRIEAPDEIRLFVSDDGRGFQPEAVAANSGGLANVRRRVEELDGRIEIASGAEGTRVAIVLPAQQVLSTAS